MSTATQFHKMTFKELGIRVVLTHIYKNRVNKE